MTPDESPAATTTFRANLALALGLAALVTWFIAVAVASENDENDWMWVVMAVLGLAALATGLRAGPGRPTGRALIGAAIGGLLVLLFIGFVVAEAVS